MAEIGGIKEFWIRLQFEVLLGRASHNYVTSVLIRIYKQGRRKFNDVIIWSAFKLVEKNRS